MKGLQKWSASWLRRGLILPLLAASVNHCPGAELTTRNFAVELTATLAGNPPEITLHWVGDQYARSYTINRKALGQPAWTRIGTAEGPATSFVDKQVRIGTGYEYQVIREGSLNYTGYGYIYAGINLPLVENRGRVILVVEESISEALAPGLLRYELDLIGDGWTVARTTVKRTDAPPVVKARIQQLYAVDPLNTSAVLLFGNVAVPYSGNITPDEHENHRGAWPADVYYGDLDGSWTDQTITSRQAERTRNHNIPGDGKFDQSQVPSTVELQVGRVDLSNMTCFWNKIPSRNEVDLLRGYLEKNHRFRHRQIVAQPRAMIFDRIGLRTPEALAATAWRNFSPFVGREIESIQAGEYFPNAANKSYLWSAVAAGGSYSYADSVGSADAFALHPVNVVFATFVGSYYGDWDVESNFLRASLGARGSLLASVYGGKPQWLFHPMALGETIGRSVKITQENGIYQTYPPFAPGTGEVHISLLGDPTLRAHPVDPPKNLRGTSQNGSLVLTWDPSAEARLQGYLVYKAAAPTGPYQRVSADLVTAREIATVYAAGETLMVRAVAITESPSGTYWNTSQGAFFPDPFAETLAQPPAAPGNLTLSVQRMNAITLGWVNNAVNASAFVIQRQGPGEPAFGEIGRTRADQTSFTDGSLTTPGLYSYRVAAVNDSGQSAFSNIASANNQPASATFLGLDRVTQGAWIGTYGTEGHTIPQLEDKLPPGCSLTLSNVLLYTPSLAKDPRALQLTTRNDARSANCWYHGSPFTLQLSFTDDNTHHVALYTMAWARKDPTYRIQVFDTVTGQLLDEQTISDINEGAYIIYKVKRQVQFRIIPPSGHLIEIYGIFIDAPSVAPVMIDPPGGLFNGKALVTLTSSPGASIYYTIDGSEPTQNSRRYAEPFWLLASAHVRTRAFSDGLQSTIREAWFTSQNINNIGFLKWDEQTSGSWIGRYGTEGYLLPRGIQKKPLYAEVTFRGASEWTWQETTGDARALFLDATGQSRRAAGWYTSDSMMIDLGVFDARSHAVAFYFVDFDQQGREQLIELFDANGSPSANYLLKDFREGRYLVINLQGNAMVRITRKKAGNAVLNGIFFDPSPEELSDPKPLVISSSALLDGVFSFRVEGRAGSRYCLDSSRDLNQWGCLLTNLLRTTTGNAWYPANDNHLYFRGHYVP